MIREYVPDLSCRYFAGLSDADLVRIFVERTISPGSNAGRANREVRRRAAKAGMTCATEWLATAWASINAPEGDAG